MGRIRSRRGKLVCAPFDTSGVLVIDFKSGRVKPLESGIERGKRKWIGMAAVGRA